MPNQTDSGVTTGRITKIRYDIAQTQVVERPYSLHRDGENIFAQEGSSNVSQLASGAWCLKSKQETPGLMSEGAPEDTILRGSVWNLAPGIKERPANRKHTELTGVDYGSDVAEKANWFLVKDVAAGASWASTLQGDLDSNPQPDPIQNANVTMDRMAITQDSLPANQQYHLKWEVPGNRVNSSDYIAGLEFGGQVTPYGNGRFYLGLSGTGVASLWEYVDWQDGNGYHWVVRDSWQYTAEDRVANAVHHMYIRPYNLPNFKGAIEFRHAQTDKPSQRSGLGSLFSRPVRAGIGHDFTSTGIPARHLYPLGRYHPSTLPPVNREFVTGPGVLKVDMRRDIRARWQVSTLAYELSGTLIDKGFQLPFFSSPRTSMTLWWIAEIPEGTTVTGKLYDAATGLELTVLTTGANYKIYAMAYQQYEYYAVFTLTSTDGKVTPILYAYDVTKDGWINTVAPGEFSGGTVEHVSISGPESDPSQDSATITVSDLEDDLDILRARASVPVRIEVMYDPSNGNNSLYNSCIFQGYIQRATATRRGQRGDSGFTAQGGVRQWPRKDWNRYEITCIGMWQRLYEALMPEPGVNWMAYTDVDGLPPKVTDCLRYVLAWAGFPASMIRVPDAPIRLFPSEEGGKDTLLVYPFTNLGEYAQKLCRDYLGWILIWDTNASAPGDPATTLSGMWHVLRPPVQPYINNYTFFTTPTAETLGHRSESYSGGVYYGSQLRNVFWDKGFITKGSLQSYVKPPEANAVIVYGIGGADSATGGGGLLQQWIVNPLSYDFFTEEDGTTIETADPTHPDYLGRIVPIAVVDPSLQSQLAVDWVATRIFDIACHGLKILSFEAPLLFAAGQNDSYDEELSYIQHSRPPRYYDPVLLNDNEDISQWLVRNCNPTYRKDHVMMARYELQSAIF